MTIKRHFTKVNCVIIAGPTITVQSGDRALQLSTNDVSFSPIHGV